MVKFWTTYYVSFDQNYRLKLLQFPICFKSTQCEIKSAQTWRCLMRNLQLFQLTRTGNKAEIPANATPPQLLYHLPSSKHSKLQNIARQEPLNLTKIARWFSLSYFKVTRCALDEVEFSFTWKFDEDRSSKWQASKPASQQAVSKPASQNANNLTSQQANKPTRQQFNKPTC